MGAVTRFVLAGTRGGANRARIVRALDEHPRTVGELAGSLDMERGTVSDHLGVLRANDVVERQGDGGVYRPTERARDDLETISGANGRSEG